MRSVCVLSLSIAALAGCAAPGDESPETSPSARAPSTSGWRGDAAIVRVIEQAAARAGVPADVLLALGWAETRLESRTLSAAPGAHEEGDVHALGEGEGARCGLFGLDEGSARAEAARVLGVSHEALCADATTEAHAAAARLRVLAGGDRAPALDDRGAWLRALDRWHPALEARGFAYGGYVARLGRRGFRALDEAGQVIFLPPDPTFGAAVADRAVGIGDIGVARAAATPDTDLASWRGPACDYRASSRGAGDVTYMIIHTCEGGFAGCLSTVTSCGGSEVSAHYVISYSGERVQAVEENDTAWHVGCLNGSSIGIEHEGFAGAPDHPDEQYCASAELVRSICDRWGIPCDRDHVIGHVEANERFCHGDHWDPGPSWDWDRFMRYVRDGCRCTPAPEVCDGLDNDCNGMLDEGVLNACGTCGAVPDETCNGADDDCDGMVDDGVCTRARLEPGALPDALDLGLWWSVSVRAVNSGTTTWPAGELALVAEGEGTESASEPLEARAVAPGESTMLRLRVRAGREGPLAIAVAAVVSGARVETPWLWQTAGRKPVLGARFVDASVPLEVRVGTPVEGWAAVVNEGREAWPRGTIVVARETGGGLSLASGPLEEVAPGATVRATLKIEAERAAIGQSVERTLIVRDPDGEEAGWPDAERVVQIQVRARDGSLIGGDEPGSSDDMLDGGCSASGASGSRAPGGALLVIAALLCATRRRRRA